MHLTHNHNTITNEGFVFLVTNHQSFCGYGAVCYLGCRPGCVGRSGTSAGASAVDDWCAGWLGLTGDQTLLLVVPGRCTSGCGNGSAAGDDAAGFAGHSTGAETAFAVPPRPPYFCCCWTKGCRRGATGELLALDAVAAGGLERSCFADVARGSGMGDGGVGAARAARGCVVGLPLPVPVPAGGAKEATSSSAWARRMS